MMAQRKFALLRKQAPSSRSTVRLSGSNSGAVASAPPAVTASSSFEPNWKSPSFEHDWSAHVFSAPTQLDVSEPTDATELEAERAADRVMSAPKPSAAQHLPQRRAPSEPAQAAEPPLGQASDPVALGIRSSRAGGGEALPEPVRSFLEPRFGADFRGVRVHRDARANALAEAVQARAFSVGPDLFFRRGEYEPSTPSGQRLIAHELSHVVQRGSDAPGASRPRIQRAVSKVCNAPSAWAALLSGANPLLLPSAVAAASAFGSIAELFVSADILKANGVGASDAYIDNGLAGPIDPLYAAFLIKKNPSLSVFAKAALAVAQVARPDVLMHDAKLQELEEIKPNSVAGRSAGRTKVKTLGAFYSSFALPYTAGATYTPMKPFVIASGTVNGVPITITFELTRDVNGLLVYDICVETDWLKVAELAILIAVLIILAIITRGAIKNLPLPKPSPALAPI